MRLIERLPLIVQMQTSKAFYDNVKASIPIVHEVAAGAGEYLECLAIRILWRSRLRFLKRNQVGLKSGAASAMLPRNSDEGQKQERRSC